MIKPPPPKRTGIAGLMLLFAGVSAGAGLLFDILSNGEGRVGLTAQPGAHAVLGVGVAALAILAAHGLRFVLGRRAQGEADAGNHT